MTYFCPSCWRTVSASDVFCPRCHSDLRALDQRAFVDKLLAALAHPDPTTRQRAVVLLGERREQQAVAPLTQMLAKTSEPLLAADIVTALAKIGGPGARAQLDWALDHDSFLVRLAALRAAAQDGGRAAERALERATHDTSPSVRRLARDLRSRPGRSNAE